MSFVYGATEKQRNNMNRQARGVANNNHQSCVRLHTCLYGSMALIFERIFTKDFIRLAGGGVIEGTSYLHPKHIDTS